MAEEDPMTRSRGRSGQDQRVLLVAHYFPPHVGGIENVVRDEAATLVIEGYTVDVLTTAVGGPVGEERNVDGYTVVRVPAWNGVEQRTRIPFPIPAPWALWTFAKRVRAADVVHCHDLLYATTWLAALLAALCRRPVVLTQHVQLVTHPSRVVEIVQRLVHRTAGRWVARRARSVVVLNAAVGDFVRGMGASSDRVVLVPNGVDTELFQPASADERGRMRDDFGLPHDKVLALFVGRFVPKKGFDKLLEVGETGCVLVLAGGSPPTDSPVHDDAIFMGSLSQERLALLYRACDLFVLPSEAEGFPLTVQEAMASGLPVVTTDDPAYAPYGLDRQHVALIEPTVPEISATLRRLAGDDELRGRMGTYSRRLATDRFSWAEHGRRIGRLYEDATARPACPKEDLIDVR